MFIDHLAMPTEFKATGASGSGEFEGYASTRKKDHDGDIVMHGAFKRTIDHLGGKGLPFLWFHRPDEPIGMIYPQGEDDHGLLVKGVVDVDVPQGHRVYSGMKKKYIDRMSIGYAAVNPTYDNDRKARLLHEIKLHEVSAITRNWSANDEALITAVKSIPTMIDAYANTYTEEGSHGVSARMQLMPDTIEELIEALQRLMASGAIDLSSGPANATRENTDIEPAPATVTLVQKTLNEMKAINNTSSVPDVRSLVDQLKNDIRNGV